MSNSSPTSVFYENAVKLFCCEALEMFYELRNFTRLHWHGGDFHQKVLNYFLPNSWHGSYLWTLWRVTFMLMKHYLHITQSCRRQMLLFRAVLLSRIKKQWESIHKVSERSPAPYWLQLATLNMHLQSAHVILSKGNNWRLWVIFEISKI